MRKTNPQTVESIKKLANDLRVSCNVSPDTFFPIKDYILSLHNKGELTYQILEDDDPLFGNDELTLAFYSDKDNTIYVKDKVDAGSEENDYRSNFTLAHELFHYMQVKLLDCKFEEVDRTESYMDPEWQADEFAGQLLIPEEYTNLSDEEISERFHVSLECAAYRKLKKKNRYLTKQFKLYLPRVIDKLKEYKYLDAIKEAKKLIALEDSQTLQKRAFDNKVETYLYLLLNEDKSVERQVVDFKELFSLYADALIHTNAYDEAETYFEKALQIAPFGTFNRVQYIETFKLRNDLDNFYKRSIEALKYSYKKEQFFLYYRNISDYYFKKENYVEALYMMLFARYVDEEKIEESNSELFKIYDCLGKKLDPSIDAIINFMDNKEIPTPVIAIDNLNRIYNTIYETDYLVANEVLSLLYDLSNDIRYLELKEKREKTNNNVN